MRIGAGWLLRECRNGIVTSFWKWCWSFAWPSQPQLCKTESSYKVSGAMSISPGQTTVPYSTFPQERKSRVWQFDSTASSQAEGEHRIGGVHRSCTEDQFERWCLGGCRNQIVTSFWTSRWSSSWLSCRPTKAAYSGQGANANRLLEGAFADPCCHGVSV